MQKESQTTFDDLEFHDGSVLMDDDDDIWVVQSINRETDLVTDLGKDVQTTKELLIDNCTKLVN